MGKGLPRSLAQAALQNVARPNSAVLTRRYVIAGVITVAAAAAGVGFGSLVLGDFPEGNIGIVSRVMNISLTTADTDVIATYAGNVSVGSAPTAAGALTGTEVDVLPSSAVGPATARTIATTRIAPSAAPGAAIDNTDGNGELNLNLAINAADITDATTAPITVAGFLELAYVVLGDD